MMIGGLELDGDSAGPGKATKGARVEEEDDVSANADNDRGTDALTSDGSIRPRLVLIPSSISGFDL